MLVSKMHEFAMTTVHVDLIERLIYFNSLPLTNTYPCQFVYIPFGK